jgi:glycosyltransferase involved in cell wall biosynthesis
MANTIILDKNYSATRLLTKEKPEIVNNPEETFETILFLPEGENRQGEGGLRTKGYFKKSYDDKPLMTIITVVYNGEKYLEETIQSVINQTYDNVEYIIIDGGSTDGTVEIIKKHEDKIDYWVSERDKGIYAAMNKGITLAHGKIIGLLNADDMYHPFVLQSIIFAYKTQNANTIIYGNAKYVVDNQVIKSVDKEFNADRLLRGFGFLHTTCFVPRNIYQTIGLFNTSYKIAGDTDFLLRCYINHTFFIKATNITYMRLGGISDVQMIQGNNEYLSQLSKYSLVSEQQLFRYKIIFRTLYPLLKIRHNKNLRKYLLQIKFFLIYSINLFYALLPFFKIKNLFLSLLDIKLGNESYIHAGIKFFNWGNINIGKNTSIGPNCYLDNRKKIVIGNNVAIAHDCKIYTLGHDRYSPFMETKGSDVIIKDNVFIYSNVLIMPGVVIGEGAIINPGAVVTTNIEPYTVNGGNPSKKINTRNKNLLYQNDYGFYFAL